MRMVSLKEWKKEIPEIAFLALVYFLAGKLGLALAFVHPSSSAIWPASGIALAALLIFGDHVWPGVLIGAFFVNWTTLGTPASSLAIAIGNTLEAVMGAYLVRRFANSRNAFDHVWDTLKFDLFAGLGAPAIAATVGVVTLCMFGFASWAQVRPILLTWWLGDGTGALLVAPLILLWSVDFRFRWNKAQFLEIASLFVCLIFTAEIVFCGLFTSSPKAYPLEYLCIPFLLWAALRFGQREAIAATILLSGIATWGTLHGHGPFLAPDRNDSLLLLQAFMAIVSAMTIALAAISAQRRHMETEILNLAVTDSLTGLANYRKLVDVLDAEVKRSNRTGRTFSVLLIDMDQLKRINDRFGHLAGSRALCRLGDILRVYCRSIDTAARFGGDEFALVMPETSEREAQQVAARICARADQDPEQPSISVSIGTAVYPRSGETVDLLLEAADRAMYEMKHFHHEMEAIENTRSSREIN
ncbi:MAG TPA: MASE1 domain-containing protein [Candidatus Acidoferrales bacterium]